MANPPLARSTITAPGQARSNLRIIRLRTAAAPLWLHGHCPVATPPMGNPLSKSNIKRRWHIYWPRCPWNRLSCWCPWVGSSVESRSIKMTPRGSGCTKNVTALPSASLRQPRLAQIVIKEIIVFRTLDEGVAQRGGFEEGDDLCRHALKAPRYGEHPLSHVLLTLDDFPTQLAVLEMVPHQLPGVQVRAIGGEDERGLCTVKSIPFNNLPTWDSLRLTPNRSNISCLTIPRVQRAKRNLS